MLFKVTLHLTEGASSGRASSSVNGESECVLACTKQWKKAMKSYFCDCLHKIFFFCIWQKPEGNNMRTDGLASLFRPRNSIHTLKVQSVTQLTWPNELSMLTNSVAASSILASLVSRPSPFFVVAVLGYPLYILTSHTQREIKTAERYKKKKNNKERKSRWW